MSPLLPTFFLVTLLANIATPIYGLNPRKLQEGPVPGSPDTEVKCGGCPCNNPCSQSPPPPPPPPPKKPPTPSIYCPPPPSYIYITGPPGNLYPVDPYYSGATRSLVVGLPLLMVCGFLGQLAFL